MSKVNFLGIDTAALSRMLKDDRKNKSTRCGWTEEDGSTYYCNGYLIIKLSGLTFQASAMLLGLGYDDTPSDRMSNLKRIWDGFKPNDYEPGKLSAWARDTRVTWKKKLEPTRVVVSENNACLVRQSFLDVFAGCSVSVGPALSGVRFECGEMEAYILPIRPGESERAVLEAIKGV